MKALRLHVPKIVKVDSVPDPASEQPGDVILRVTSTAIGGSDLDIHNGLFPQLRPLTLGHEFMGVVEEPAPPCRSSRGATGCSCRSPIACGSCWFCTHARPTACENSNPNYGLGGRLFRQKGAGLFGYTDLYGGSQGEQAEFVRVPFADHGPRKVPDALTNEQALVHTCVDRLLQLVADGRIRTDDIITHTLPLTDGPRVTACSIATRTTV